MNSVTRTIVKLVFSLAIAVGASTIFLMAVSAHAMPVGAANAARSAANAAVQSAVQSARDDAARKVTVQQTVNQKYRR
jgi:hypothetical protein